MRGRAEKRAKKVKINNRSKSKNRKKIRRYPCHEESHFRIFFPRRKKGEKKIEIEDDATLVKQGYECSDVLVVTTKSSDKKWVMDSGCSFHITPNQGWFKTYKKMDCRQILLGNNKACKVNEIGTMRLKTGDGIERILNDVRYVLEKKSYFTGNA